MTDRLAIVMAAGKGTRMESDLPKVLVTVCGRPMIDYVIEALRKAHVDKILVVVGYQSHLVREHLGNQRGIVFVEQTEQLGTGHAVMMCESELAGYRGPVLIVAGDSPMMQTDSIEKLFEEFSIRRPACILGTGYRNDPTGFGRIVRDNHGDFQAIVEEKDASPEQRAITEINLSCYVFASQDLIQALARLENTNAQREYYLTDCPRILMEEGKAVVALDVLKPCEALSVNTVQDLAAVEAAMRVSIANPTAPAPDEATEKNQ